jgi:Fe-S cluster assembly iron-binding protein IscA
MVIKMDIQLTALAAAKLKLLLWEETKDKPLAIRIVLLTSGCSTPSFCLEVTEQKKQLLMETIADVPFIQYPEDKQWIDGIIIDLNRENGKFHITHPNPEKLSNCPLPQGGVDY